MIAGLRPYRVHQRGVIADIERARGASEAALHAEICAEYVKQRPERRLSALGCLQKQGRDSDAAE